ncbi:hypothetical protein L249_1710 [Ophiocordyceps polyrhachis-furcata BCC 54312]|uniref:MHYT domain-containing protein n=1 Tax=Ophiocordyceps polyrhachis-furcata BCC 54312 TaxID=1330021 RepID=A0A367LQP1_9HYPO|nr:hypothetical protein L249_1710 [Ophiocordyceps polyrhachis-furcata BCC 54312]
MALRHDSLPIFASMTPTSQQFVDEYAGRMVPVSFNAGFVCLSYAISLIGTCSTLELLRRRTSHKGFSNLLLLIGAAISMGGIAIWSMHFIGNRAIFIFDGREDLQIAYSTGMTVLSLIVPIFVLVVAFLATSINGRIRLWRIYIAGFSSGGAICGMHYLADASISNYQACYKVGYVAGATVIAVVASTAALTLFFVFETAWKVVWWKRLGCAMVLAGAVSGMHWCAAVGTSYKLLRTHGLQNGMSRQETLIMVICLSIAAGVALTTSSIYSGWVRREYASKSQQVVLAAAVFDDKGRIMVNQEGFVPTEVVTDTFIAKTHNESFDTSHPLFQWMYRASRNWNSIAPLTEKMETHISQLSHDKYNNRIGLKLIAEDGLLVPFYDQMICELFSLAALALARKTKEDLAHIGTLWDEIFVTGNVVVKSSASGQLRKRCPGSKDKSLLGDLAEKGLVPIAPQYGRGCLMFLVRHLNGRRETEKLEASGFRFAEMHHVMTNISSSMQIKNPDFAERLRTMSMASNHGSPLPPWVHVGIFAIRARLDRSGFDVLVRKDARNSLPTGSLPLRRLEPWHQSLLCRLQGQTPSEIIQSLYAFGHQGSREAQFGSYIRGAIRRLQDLIGEEYFGNATFMPHIVQVPCCSAEDSSRLSTCPLLSFRAMLPIHATAPNAECEFVPLSFFQTQQMVYKGSAHHVEFSHKVHRELSSFLHVAPAQPFSAGQRRSFPRSLMAWIRRPRAPRRADDQLQSSSPSQKRLSTAALSSGWPRTPSDEMSFNDWLKRQSVTFPSPDSNLGRFASEEFSHRRNKLPNGGIMISQQITVDVEKLPGVLTTEVSLGSKSGDYTRPSDDTRLCQEEAEPPAKANIFSTAIGDRSTQIALELEGSGFVNKLLVLCMDNKANL